MSHNHCPIVKSDISLQEHRIDSCATFPPFKNMSIIRMNTKRGGGLVREQINGSFIFPPVHMPCYYSLLAPRFHDVNVKDTIGLRAYKTTSWCWFMAV